MDANNLIRMANQIGSFFESMPDRQQALADISGHLNRFWAPRMRRALLHFVDQQDGAQLNAIVLEALRTHKAAML